MLTLENTSGFDQATLDKMNAEVEVYFNVYSSRTFDIIGAFNLAEWKVLEKYGGLRI